MNPNYSVSNLGNVKNDKTGKILKLLGSKGYVKVRLYGGSHSDYIQIGVHRLVALEFQDICGEYKDGLQVDHINTIRDDNRAENLRWVTKLENVLLNGCNGVRFAEQLKLRTPSGLSRHIHLTTEANIKLTAFNCKSKY